MRSMFKFIAPLWISMVINTLLGITDFYFLESINRNYLTVVGIAYIPFTLLSSLIVGIGIEANRSTAKNNKLDFDKIVIASIFISILVSFVSMFFSDYLLFFAHGNIVYTEIKEYFNILVFLLIPTSILYLCTGILRGEGIPQKSIYFNVSAVILNLVLDYLFIKFNWFGSPLKGCAYASILSDFIVAILYIRYLKLYILNDVEKLHCVSLKVFLKNSFSYSLEKVFSASSLTLVSSIYIAKLDISASSIYYGIERFFMPITMLSYCYFEWIIYSASKKIKNRRINNYIAYFLILIITLIIVGLYMRLDGFSFIYGMIYVLYCLFFFIEREIVAIYFVEEKVNFINTVILAKNIILILCLQMILIKNMLSIYSIGILQCIILVFECMFIFFYSNYKN